MPYGAGDLRPLEKLWAQKQAEIAKAKEALKKGVPKPKRSTRVENQIDPAIARIVIAETAKGTPWGRLALAWGLSEHQIAGILGRQEVNDHGRATPKAPHFSSRSRKA